MKHYEIDAHWPDGHIQTGLCYGVNWRKIRSFLRKQQKERPKCTFTIRRIQPEARRLIGRFPASSQTPISMFVPRREPVQYRSHPMNPVVFMVGVFISAWIIAIPLWAIAFRLIKKH